MTAVPDLFSSMNSRSSRRPSVGSTLPVGSSASSRLRPRDHRARDRRALLLAAGQDRRQRIHALAEADPFQEIDDFTAVGGFLAPHHPERQCDVLVSRHVIEQAKVLQHDADTLAQIGDRVLAEQRDVVAEQVDQPARRPQRQKQQPQQGGFAGAGRAGEELEGMGAGTWKLRSRKISGPSP